MPFLILSKSSVNFVSYILLTLIHVFFHACSATSDRPGVPTHPGTPT